MPFLLSHRRKKVRLSVFMSAGLPVSLPHSFNIRSLAVSLGSEHIDSNSYRKRTKSSCEITFSRLKG